MTDLHTLFEQFQTRLKAATDAELAETFNRETGNRGWAAVRIRLNSDTREVEMVKE